MINHLESKEVTKILLENGYEFEGDFRLMDNDELNEIFHDYYCDEPCMYDEGKIS